MRVSLCFLASRGEAAPGLDRSFSLPLVYSAERLPRALPWDTVRAFLSSIDRTARTGRRDYAMFLLAATYGLRCSEIASLRLDNIRWQEEVFHIQRPKARTPIHLPVTKQAGAAHSFQEKDVVRSLSIDRDDNSFAFAPLADRLHDLGRLRLGTAL